MSVAMLCAAEVLVVVGSWLLAALFPGRSIRSLLDSAGLRWLLGTYRENVSGDIPFYIFLAAFSVGMFVCSGLGGMINRLLRKRKQTSASPAAYYERRAVGVFVSMIVLSVALCALFALWPHSLLLDINGTIFSPLYLRAASIIIVVAVSISGCAAEILCNRTDPMRSIAHALTAGMRVVVPFLLLYYLIAGLVRSVLYAVSF